MGSANFEIIGLYLTIFATKEFFKEELQFNKNGGANMKNWKAYHTVRCSDCCSFKRRFTGSRRRR